MTGKYHAWYSPLLSYRTYRDALIFVAAVLLLSYSFPLLRAYSVPLSDDISAILVKNQTRTILDLIPEATAKNVPALPSLSTEPYQRQAMLNAYGAALNLSGIKTQEGLLVVKSKFYAPNTILTLPPKFDTDQTFEDEYLYLNNIEFPKIKVPSILTMAQGNSDTLALTLYFLEEINHGNWSNHYKINITGALNNPVVRQKVTSIGSVQEKSKLKLDSKSILIIPAENKDEVKEIKPQTYFIQDLKGLVRTICSLPKPGTLCFNTTIKKNLNSRAIYKIRTTSASTVRADTIDTRIGE